MNQQITRPTLTEDQRNSLVRTVMQMCKATGATYASPTLSDVLVLLPIDDSAEIQDIQARLRRAVIRDGSIRY